VARERSAPYYYYYYYYYYFFFFLPFAPVVVVGGQAPIVSPCFMCAGTALWLTEIWTHGLLAEPVRWHIVAFASVVVVPVVVVVTPVVVVVVPVVVPVGVPGQAPILSPCLR